MLLRKQVLATLAGRLRDGLAAGDWEAIAVMDEECRTLVAALCDEDAFAPEMRKQLAELSCLYDELQQSDRAERERLVGELTRLNGSKHVHQAYVQ
ncbi:flagellar protein FliT [Stutzerimonas stutzeri]|uniref:flagellar protein FliT n=1 Tax=Stutzerimonas stutzeri TaxID=316 RepID=UPI00210C4EBC|nr:flagellar protein FliT [Stutzerimonas stutzeri]MCQ4258383.1 flagellar protein FliT [Stutzerimonas stutzeri]